MSDQIPRKSWLKGMLPMGICCTAPFLLILAILLFGISLPGVAGGLLPLIAIFVVPLGCIY